MSVAKENDIELEFEFNLEDKELTSYKDVIFYKESLLELKEQLKKLEKEYLEAKKKKSVSDLKAFTTNMEVISGVKVMIAIVENYEVDIMKQIVDVLCNKYDDCFVLLANVNANNNVNIIAKSNSDKMNCGAVVKELSIKCKGNGGGSKQFAQGGGSHAEDISKYLSEIKDDIKNMA